MITIIIVAVIILAGLLATGLVLMRLAIRREERDAFFTPDAQTPLAKATRSITGLHVCKPERPTAGDAKCVPGERR